MRVGLHGILALYQTDRANPDLKDGFGGYAKECPMDVIDFGLILDFGVLQCR